MFDILSTTLAHVYSQLSQNESGQTC